MILSYDTANIPPFTKGDIRRAGEVLKRYHTNEQVYSFNPTIDEKQPIEQVLEAFRMVQQWRGLHRYPLNTLQSLFRGILKREGFKKEDFKIGQREKRMPTIIDKLSSDRYKTGTLDEMQDIGGIRIVVRDMKALQIFRAALEGSRSKQRKRYTKDYIISPKSDGYRCIHFVYKTHLPKAPAIIQGMQVELQLRTSLQHYWATAVESVDMFYGESLKTGRGAEDWKAFFLLASSAFALMEHSPCPEKYRNHTNEQIAAWLQDMENETRPFSRLRVIESTLKRMDIKKISNAPYYLLIFAKDGGKILPTLTIGFPEEETARSFYNYFESIQEDVDKKLEYLHLFERPSVSGERNMDDFIIQDIVLVKTDKKQLKALYSNYFLDINQFLKRLEKFAAEHGYPVGDQQGKAR